MVNWYKVPLRKPLAVYASLLVGGSIGIAIWRGVDLPPNISSLLQWFGGITITAYYASSTTEAVKGVAECLPKNGS